jgi:hypothetical protein
VTHNENETPHPAIHHHREAAAHLRKAAAHLDHALGQHEKGAHTTAEEAAKMAAGHIGEAQAHLAEAQRVHAAHGAHGKGSHWNDAGEQGG